MSKPQRLGSFLSQSAMLTAASVLTAAAAAVYSAVTGRLLGPAEYGVVATMIALTFLLATILNPLETGICKFAASYHGENDSGKLAALLGASLRRAGVFLAGVLLLWLPLLFWLREWLHEGSLLMLLWLTAYAAMLLPTTVFRAVLRGDHRFVEYGINQVVDSTVRLGAGWMLLWLNTTASAALAGYSLGVGAALLLGGWQLRDVRRHPAVPIDTRRFIEATIPPFFLYLMAIVSLDMLAAKHFLADATEAGRYGAASTLARLLYVGCTPLLQVLFSRVAALHAAKQDVRRLVGIVSLAVAIALLVSNAVPWLWGERVLQLVFDERFAGGAAVLQILWLTTSLRILQSLGMHVLLATDRTRGSWLFLLPCLVLAILLGCFHETGVQIALSTLGAVTAGLAALGCIAFLQSIPTKKPLDSAADG